LLIFIGFVGAASPKKTIKFKNANVWSSRIVSCNGTLPVNAIANTGNTYVQILNPYGIRKPEKFNWSYSLSVKPNPCTFRCDTWFMWRNGQCIVSNTRIQDCGGSLPSNATSFVWKTSFTQTSNNGSWSPSPSISSKYRRHRFVNLGSDPQLCAFTCNEWYTYAQKIQSWIRIDYCTQSTWSLLLETRSKICYWNLPSNAISVSENTYVDSYFCIWAKGCQFWRNRSDGDVSYPCSYKCNEWYGFANWWCTPQRFQPCAWSIPVNAISNASATWYIQTLIANVWKPTISSNSLYTWHYSAGPFLCTFKCNLWFSWKNWQCTTL
jgi:hypothetical protein